MKIKVYFACALLHASDEFKKGIEDFKNMLRKIENVVILDFVPVLDGTAHQVYENDIHTCVRNADLIIAECSGPSTGLGWELGTAVELHKKPVFAVAKEGSKVSRIVLGAQSERNPNFSFTYYASTDELLSLCKKKIEDILGK